MQPLSKRAIASRANRAKSQGPTSPAGKRRSSANSNRHGLLAKCIILTYESESVFQQFFDEHLQKLNPADAVEYAVVEEIAVAAFAASGPSNPRSSINKAIGRSTENSAPGRIADAFTSLGANNQLQLLDRYETRLQRMYQRGLKTLVQIRKVPQVQPYTEPNEPVTPELPNEPNSGLTIYTGSDVPTPISDENPDQTGNSPEDGEVVAQAPAALKPHNSNQPPATHPIQSRRPGDSASFQLIEFPSNT